MNEEYRDAFKEAEDLVRTLVMVTANGVDPKDFGAIRVRARKWLNTHFGDPIQTDKEILDWARKHRIG
jgi:hypothetical protein